MATSTLPTRALRRIRCTSASEHADRRAQGCSARTPPGSFLGCHCRRPFPVCPRRRPSWSGSRSPGWRAGSHQRCFEPGRSGRQGLGASEPTAGQRWCPVRSASTPALPVGDYVGRRSGALAARRGASRAADLIERLVMQGRRRTARPAGAEKFGRTHTRVGSPVRVCAAAWVLSRSPSSVNLDRDARVHEAGSAGRTTLDRLGWRNQPVEKWRTALAWWALSRTPIVSQPTCGCRVRLVIMDCPGGGLRVACGPWREGRPRRRS